jgi:guanylate kinase
MRLAVSATTRAPRPGERDGREYHFLGEEEFEQRVRAGEFIEHAEYAGNRYGTLRSELEGDGAGIVLEIDLQGARQIRATLPEATQVFIAPPSPEDLRRRLEGRASDTPEQIARRLERAEVELAAQQEFAKVVVNDDVETALGELVDLAARMCGSGPPERREEP